MRKEKNKQATVFSFAGNYSKLTYLGCFLSGVSAVISLIPFICIWLVIRDIFAVLPNVSEAGDIAKYGWAAVFSAIGSILVYFAGLMCTHVAAFRTARNMRSRVLHHIVKLPLGYFDGIGSGKLRRIIDESAGQTEGFLAHQMPDMTGAFVTPIAAIVIILFFDWRLGLISVVPVIIGFLCMVRMTGPGLQKKMSEYQNSLEDMNNEAVEYIRGVPVVKTFGQTVFSFKNFHDSIMRYKKWVVEYTLSLRLPMTGFSTAINGIFALLIPAGILLIASAADYEAFLLDFIFYILFTPLFSLMMTRIMYASENSMMTQDAVNRINSILEAEPLQEPERPKKPKDANVSFINVTFSYPGSRLPAVKKVSFTVKPGQTVAFVGPSGGGKTTVASLIPRFFDAEQGSVQIGGVDVREIAGKELMNMVSFVFQNTNLFKASILENIKAAKPEAGREEVIKAVKIARCQDIIDKMPEGIDTVIGTKGIYLSGGEAQRIALARAILKDAPIVLLDEATAFADPENEYQIQLAFEELVKGKTVLMIAHRLSTIRNADCIMVLAEGEIKEQGSHEKLLANHGIYETMWKDYQTSVAWRIGKEGMSNA